MEFKTKRCLIRPFQITDIDDFMEYRNNEKWMQYQGFKGLKKEEYEKELLYDVSLDKGIQLAIVDINSNILLGDIYLKKEENVVWVGYTIHPSHSRNGYAYEALKGIIEWASLNNIEQVNAGALANNEASIELLKKAGFIFNGFDNDEQIFIYKI